MARPRNLPARAQSDLGAHRERHMIPTWSYAGVEACKHRALHAAEAALEQLQVDQGGAVQP